MFAGMLSTGITGSAMLASMPKRAPPPAATRAPPEFRLYGLARQIAKSRKSQTEIAREVGIGRSHMSNVVSGKRGVSAIVAARISAAVKASLDELLNEQNNTISLDGIEEEDRAAIVRMVERLRGR